MNKIDQEIFAYYSLCRQPPFCCYQQSRPGGHTRPVQEGPHLQIRGLPPGVHPDHRESGEKSPPHESFVEHCFHFIVIWKCRIIKSTGICRKKEFLLKFWNAENWNQKRFFKNAFDCNFCGNLFLSKSHLRIHNLVYH